PGAGETGPGLLLLRALDEAHDDGRGLGARGGGGGGDEAVLVALDDAFADGPAHGLVGPGADAVRVAGREQEVHDRLAAAAPEHGHELLSRDGAHGVRAVGDAGLHGPVAGLGIPGLAALGVRALDAGQDGPDHCAGQAAVGVEYAGVHAVHEAVFAHVGHGVVIPRARGHVREAEALAPDEHGADRDLAARHGEGVSAAAEAAECELRAVGAHGAEAAEP